MVTGEAALAQLDGGPGDVQADVARVTGQRELGPVATAELDNPPDFAGADEVVEEVCLGLARGIVRTWPARSAPSVVPLPVQRRAAECYPLLQQGELPYARDRADQFLDGHLGSPLCNWSAPATQMTRTGRSHRVSTFGLDSIRRQSST